MPPKGRGRGISIQDLVAAQSGLPIPSQQAKEAPKERKVRSPSEKKAVGGGGGKRGRPPKKAAGGDGAAPAAVEGSQQATASVDTSTAAAPYTLVPEGLTPAKVVGQLAAEDAAGLSVEAVMAAAVIDHERALMGNTREGGASAADEAATSGSTDNNNTSADVEGDGNAPTTSDNTTTTTSSDSLGDDAAQPSSTANANALTMTPLKPFALGFADETLTPMETMAQHIIAHTMVGRQVPDFTNRAFIMPTCYVPQGSDTLEEVEQRARQQGDGNATTPTTTANDGEALTDGVAEGSAADASAANNGEPTQAAVKRGANTTVAAEEGVQFDTINAFMCPFMVHQRVAVQPFVAAPSEIVEGNRAAKQQQVDANAEEVLDADDSADGAEKSAKPSSSSSSALPAYELTPAIVIANAYEKVRQMAAGLDIPVTGTQPSTTTFAVEQTLMRHRARPLLATPSVTDEYLLMECDVRLGTVAVFPKVITQTVPMNLTDAQKEYVSRFQLLEQAPDAGSSSSTTITPAAPAEGEEGQQQPEEAKGDIHVASDIVVGAFDPYFTQTHFGTMQQSLKRMSVTKLDKAAEAVQLRSKVPIYQLTFQARAGGDENAEEGAAEDAYSTKSKGKGGVLILESHDNGQSWHEIRSQEGLGAITTPIVNSKKHAMEAVFTAKHIRRCDSVECEWATYYLNHTFGTNKKKGAVGGGANGGDGSGNAKDGVQGGGAKGGRAAEEISEVGYVHPTSDEFTEEYALLRQKWQLVCVERVNVQAAQCTESSRMIGGLANAAEGAGMEHDEHAVATSMGASSSSSTNGAIVKGQGIESSLIMWLWHHTKTLFADDGISFVRGATTFRRRVSISNEHLLRERSTLWDFTADDDGKNNAIGKSRYGSALQTVFNECSSTISAKFSEITQSPDKGYNSLAGSVPVYVFANANANGVPQTVVPPMVKRVEAAEVITDASEIIAEEEKLEEAEEKPAVEEVTPAVAETTTAAVEGTAEAAAPAALADAPSNSGAIVPITSTISVAEHGAFLQRFAKTALPILDLAKSFAFHAYIPWGTVHYPLSLNNFTDMQLPLNLTFNDASKPLPEALTRMPSTTQLPTFLLRNQGTVGILKSPRPDEQPDRVLTAANGPLSFDKAAFTAEAELAVADGMRALFSSSFDASNTPEYHSHANSAPVFTVTFGHTDGSSFDTQGVLADVLVRMLGKSVKTTVSALCFSDHPSAAVRSLKGDTAAHVNASFTPLGTRSITSVYLDSKDASRSQVTNIGKLFKSPDSQEYGVRTLLRRMLAPSSLEQAQVLVQSAPAAGKGGEGAAGRELAVEDPIAEGAETATTKPTEQQPYVYKVSVLPEEALDVFRPVAYGGTVDQGDASNLAELSARLSAVEALFSKAASSQGSGQDGLKEMIRTSVSVSQVILENSKATSIAQLLESRVRGESTFAYLPQLLEAESDGTVTVEGKGANKLKSLLHRDLSRVVFAEDKYFVSEGMQGSRNRTDPVPTTHVIHRTIHDVCVGSDGIARYEKANFVFFTLRDPNIITGARGRTDRVQEMLEAVEATTANGAAKAGSSASAAEVPHSASSRDVPLISDIFGLLHNFGRWGVDKQFAIKTTRDTLQLEGRTASGEAVHHVLQGWLQSALSQQSADVLAMVQGDERSARNPLVHILIDAANKCAPDVQKLCRNELLHWVSGLNEVAAIMSPRELEHAYLTMDMKRVFRKSGIPYELLPHIFHPKDGEGSGASGDENADHTIRDPFLRNLPCDTHCKLTSKLLVDFGSEAVVPVTIPKTLHTSDGMPVPEGSVAFVGHATADLIAKCNNYFGEMAPIHQLGDLLVIPATQDIDASLAVELSVPQETVWRSSLELQFARMKLINGQSAVMKRYRHNQFVPPTVLERSFIQSGNRYAIPEVGAPLYKKGKLVTFNKGYGAHEFVAHVLQSANLRKVVSFITK